MSLDRYGARSFCRGYGAGGMAPFFTSDRERGFTLLEVMAALAILGMGVLMVIQLFSGGLGLARAARNHSGAVLLAREKMSETMADVDLQAGVTEGEAGEGARGFHWKVEVSPYESALTEDNMTMEIFKVVVSVRGRGRGHGAFTLSSLRSVWYEGGDEE